MKYLTPAQVLFIHDRLLEEMGGKPGIRDLGMLKSALARPKATFDRKALYPGLFARASALMESLINNHPFLDGNKRTGISTAGIFLQINGWRLVATSDELESVTLQIAKKELTREELAGWLKVWSRPWTSNRRKG